MAQFSWQSSRTILSLHEMLESASQPVYVPQPWPSEFEPPEFSLVGESTSRWRITSNHAIHKHIFLAVFSSNPNPQINEYAEGIYVAGLGRMGWLQARRRCISSSPSREHRSPLSHISLTLPMDNPQWVTIEMPYSQIVRIVELAGSLAQI